MTLNTDKLKKAIKLAASFCEKRSTMPILSKLAIECLSDKIKITASDLECSIVTTVDYTGGAQSFKFLVDGKEFNNILKNIKTPVLDLNIDANNLQIKSNGFVFNLIFELDYDSYPILPAMSDVFLKYNFTKGFEKVEFATSKDKTRYHLNGVFVEINKGETIFTATDSRRLANYTDDAINNCNADKFILPNKFIKKYLQTFKDDLVSLRSGIDNNYLFFEQNQNYICVRKIEGRYPNYQQFIPLKFSHGITFNKKELLDTLNSFKPLVNKGNCIIIESSGEQVTVKNSVYNYELKNKKEVELLDLPLSFKTLKVKRDTSIDLTFGCNLLYLIDAIETIESEKIKLLFNDKLSPFRIGEKNLINVLMPMRVEK